MNPTRWRIAALLIATLLAQLLLSCGAALPSTVSELPPTPSFQPFATPTPPAIIAPTNPDFDNAQATVAAGKSQLSDLSRRATEDSLAIAKTENAAALATQQASQNQLLELGLQATATAISQDVANAAATEKSVKQQAKAAREATAAAQRAAATATQSAVNLNQAIIAQAQVIVDGELTQTAQVVAAATAYPMTATDVAATRAAQLTQEYQREQDNFVNQIVTPLIPVVAAILFILTLILIIVVIKRQLIPLSWFRPSLDRRKSINPTVMIDGVMADYSQRPHPIDPSEFSPENIPMLPCEKLVYVEYVNPNELPVARWVDEVEQQLAAEGGL